MNLSQLLLPHNSVQERRQEVISPKINRFVDGLNLQSESKKKVLKSLIQQHFELLTGYKKMSAVQQELEIVQQELTVSPEELKMNQERLKHANIYLLEVTESLEKNKNKILVLLENENFKVAESWEPVETLLENMSENS